MSKTATAPAPSPTETPEEALRRRHEECFEDVREALQRHGFRIVAMLDPGRMERVGEDGVLLRAGWGLEPIR